MICLIFDTTVILFVHLYDKKHTLKQCKYKTIQVNEAIMQNTGYLIPFDPLSYLERETSLSGFLSTYLSASFISWDWVQSETVDLPLHPRA